MSTFLFYLMKVKIHMYIEVYICKLVYYYYLFFFFALFTIF